MNLIDRVKNILLTPKTEWEVIKAESTSQKEIIVGYVLPLAAVSAVCGFLGTMFIMSAFFGASFLMFGVLGMVLRIIMAVVSVFVVGFIIDALAPNFGGTKNPHQAFKVAAYSFTAAFVGGIFTIVPYIGWLIGMLVSLYGFYLLYLGLKQLMGSPDDKVVVYEVIVVIITIVVMAIANVIVGLASGPALMGGAYLRGSSLSPGTTEAVVRSNVAASKLEAMGKQMEIANKKMEAANKSGDQNAQAAAAMEVLGAAMSGGRKVEPLSVEEVKAFVPEKFAGLPKTSSAAERSGVSTLMVTTAKATYGDNAGKSVRLEVTDAGGAGAMVGLASWMGAMNMEREDDRGAERTKKEGNRVVHEKVSKTGGDNEFSLVLAERYVVKAVGSGVDLGTLKGGVSGMDLAKLESLKDAGVARN
ncbi:hypothetical protein DSM104443_00476 [Usitatibacter rugosus]|uniref:Yip1 domain-containing protein n=1 Tax=Usitatibacter rugosus TaxID=2732067 RepID=A0A6M4GQL2_9PROT|nr:Yip1 family protein [Usitatibacter rugosus]QJR09432.1 hypothetical protein DSM104443_00476 [Usitatibacter rugosus]